LCQAFHPSAQTAFSKTLIEVDSAAAHATSSAIAVVPPDVAVAFRLYRDSGRIVNLADWWQAFEQAAADEEEGGDAQGTGAARAGGKRKPGGSEDGMEVDGKDGEEEDDEGDENDTPRRRKQARFLRAVADLAHAGYVQPTSRKVEHVGKTIF